MNNNLGRQFKVLDFQAAKFMKERTGRAAAIPHTTEPDSPALIKHENEAMAQGNPVKKKQSLKDKYYTKMGQFLGFE